MSASGRTAEKLSFRACNQDEGSDCVPPDAVEPLFKLNRHHFVTTGSRLRQSLLDWKLVEEYVASALLESKGPCISHYNQNNLQICPSTTLQEGQKSKAQKRNSTDFDESSAAGKVLGSKEISRKSLEMILRYQDGICLMRISKDQELTVILDFSEANIRRSYVEEKQALMKLQEERGKYQHVLL
nr:hypothetical protein Iba_chr15cCG6760 [Ipomoea batatas]